jgi:PAS domain S-box-containing protein
VAEEELRQQNEELMATRSLVEFERDRYQELFELAPDGYFVTDRDGTIQEANQQAGRLLGTAPDLLLGKPLVVFVPVSQRAKFRARLKSLLPSTIQEWETMLQPRQGEPLDVSIRAVMAQKQSDGSTWLRWSIRDIRPQKQIERQLHALNADLSQRTRLDAIVQRIGNKLRESLEESQILQTAVKELALALNLLACDAAIYDLPEKRSIVQSCYPSPHPTGVPSQTRPVAMADFPEGYRQLLQGQEFQFCSLRTPSEEQMVSILACPIWDHQEGIGDLWCFCQADSPLQPYEVFLVRQVADQCAIALRQSRQYHMATVQNLELERLNRIKDDFLSTVSLELRMPLTNIKMALHLLKVANTEEKRARCVEILQKECDREIDLVTTMLDLQQMQINNTPTYLLEAIHLVDWLPIILAPFEGRFQSSQQPFRLILPESLPPLIADSASLRRVLLELLQNANKYTAPGGEISLTVQLNSDENQVEFIIQNQAVIPEKERAQIFNLFYRIPNSTPWQNRGTGLGLALVKQLVDRLRGHIQVDSRQGWTAFSVTLPLHGIRN